jgi:hypothetical protein
LRSAYAYPDRPGLPPEALADEKEVAAGLEKQEAALEWIAAQLLAANAGSRFVSSTDLKRMVPPAIGGKISVADLEKAAPELLRIWASDTYLPDHLEVGDQYLSLADAFYVLATALGEQHRTGKRPESVRLAAVYGPLETPDDHGPALGSVTPAAVARVSSSLVTRLNDTSWKPLPSNMIPAWLEVDGLRVNSAQFLRLMLESLVTPSRDARINVKMTNMFSAAGLVYPKMRDSTDQGCTWTFRPAPLNTGQKVLSSQR